MATIDPTPEPTAARHDELVARYHPDKAAARAADRAADRAALIARTGHLGAGWVFHHRNGSGNGAPFTARLAEDALVITFEDDTISPAIVAIPASDLRAAHQHPTVDDGQLVTWIRPFPNPAAGTDVVTAVREQCSTLTRIRQNTEHLGRMLIIDAGRNPTTDMDRVAGHGPHLVVEENDTTGLTNGWRPETFHTGINEQRTTAAA